MNEILGSRIKVLNETPVVTYRAEENRSSKKIFDMFDLFYANKHMYEKLPQRRTFGGTR